MRGDPLLSLKTKQGHLPMTLFFVWDHIIPVNCPFCRMPLCSTPFCRRKVPRPWECRWSFLPFYLYNIYTRASGAESAEKKRGRDTGKRHAFWGGDMGRRQCPSPLAGEGHFAERQPPRFCPSAPSFGGEKGGRALRFGIFRRRTAKKQDFLRGARKNILCANSTKNS